MSAPNVTDAVGAGVADDGTIDGGASQSLLLTVLSTNSISIVACVGALTLYGVLLRNHRRLLSRLSLRLAALMAVMDLVFHISNLSGYGDLPKGFICGFVGGFLFTLPSMASILFSCAIAFNLQLVMVFKKQPSEAMQKYFIGVPVVLSLLMTLPPLFLGWFGFDDTYQYCWYSSDGVSRDTILLRVLLTYNLWALVASFYLIVASATVIPALFTNASRISHLTETVDGQTVTTTSSLGRKNAARRALTIRLLGFIALPVICIVPNVIVDIVVKQGTNLPDVLTTIITGIQGLAGTFNAILVASDPAVLAIFYARRAARENRYKTRRGIPLTFSSTREGEPTFDGQSENDKQPMDVDPEQAQQSEPSGIVIKVEVMRQTDVIEDTESDLYGM